MFMKKLSIKQKAIALRKEGYSYGYIAKEVEVSKSTLSTWLSEIPYTPNQKTLETIGKARTASGKKKAEIKLQSIKEAKTEALKEMGNISNRDLFMLGIGLYIGEGSKTTQMVRIVNSNPRIIKLAIRWFDKVCGLKVENFALRIHMYPDNKEKETLDMWVKFTGIPLSQFHKTQIDNRAGKKMGKRGKLPYGTGHLTVRSNGNKAFGVYLSRKIEAWMDRALNN